MADDPIIEPSARRHGVPDDTILHAFYNAFRAEELYEGLAMLIGPDRAGNLYEVGVVRTDSGRRIVHAMRARPKYVR